MEGRAILSTRSKRRAKHRMASRSSAQAATKARSASSGSNAWTAFSACVNKRALSCTDEAVNVKATTDEEVASRTCADTPGGIARPHSAAKWRICERRFRAAAACAVEDEGFFTASASACKQ